VCFNVNVRRSEKVTYLHSLKFFLHILQCFVSCSSSLTSRNVFSGIRSGNFSEILYEIYYKVFFSPKKENANIKESVISLHLHDSFHFRK